MRTGKLQAAGLLIAGLLLAAVAAPAAAQDSGTTMKQVGLVRTGSGTFSLTVEGADIRTVLRAISEFSGRNIVVGKDVKGSVKVALKNVTWQDALRSVLRANGLDYVEEGSLIRVDEATKLNAEQVERETARSRAAELVALETRIVRLNYANAQELQTALVGSLSRRGTVQVDRRTNSLLINDVPANIEKVVAMANDLDSTTPQIEITAKLVDVDAEALRGLGIEWNLGGNGDELSGPNASRPNTAETPNFSPSSGTDPRPFHPFDDVEHVLAGEHNTGIADPALRVTYGIFKDWLTLEAQLQLLEQERKANIISNPRITTVNNREAKILVGQKIPLIVQDVAGNPLSQLQTIGVQLRVTPQLTVENRVIMDLHPEVSDLSSQSTVQGGVIINTSEADTRVMVDDGQTAVIGGLIRTNEGHVRRGVPILMNIPLLGNLFRSENRVSQNRELVIFVTPRIITSMASK